MKYKDTHSTLQSFHPRKRKQAHVAIKQIHVFLAVLHTSPHNPKCEIDPADRSSQSPGLLYGSMGSDLLKTVQPRGHASYLTCPLLHMSCSQYLRNENNTARTLKICCLTLWYAHLWHKHLKVGFLD